MPGYITFNGQRFSTILYCLCCALFIMFTAGCGDESTQSGEGDIGGADSKGTGSVAVSVRWHTPSDNPNSAHALAGPQAIADCSAAGVETITCEVYDDTNTPIAGGGPWPCDTPGQQGAIERIPAGPNITFTVLGWNADQTAILYQGQTTGVTITPNETEAVDIDAYEFVPTDLSAIAISNSQVELSWSMAPDMEGAIDGYNIYRDGVLHDTTATTTYNDTTDLSPLTEYCYTVTAYDAYGNESGATDPEVCATTTDNATPVSVITEPADGAAFEPGVSITFSGTGTDPEDGALTGGSLVWTSSIDGGIGTGASFATAVLSTGTHTITLTATDSNGASGSDAITITVGTNEPPTAAITAPADGATFEAGDAITFSGTGADPEDGTLTGGSLVWTSSIDGGIGTGESFVSAALSSGTHTITLAATDSDGVSGSDAITISVDPNDAPTAAITAPADGATFDVGDAITFSGTGADPEDGTLTGASLVWTSSLDGEIGTGESFVSAALSIGTHTITLTATDSDGAGGSDTITMIIGANDAPTAAITAPADGATFESGDAITFSGTGTDPEDGALAGGSLVWTSSIDGAIGTGESFASAALSSGTHTITLTATDSDGAGGSDAITIIVDPNDAPTAVITAPADGATFESGDAITFSGTGTDPEDGALTGGALVWTSSIDGGIGTSGSFTTATLSTGTHTITLTATDSDGASDSDTITITVDPNDPPVATITSPTTGAAFESGDAITFSGTGTDPEDGALTGGALVWASSIDGGIGTGTTFSTSSLSTGTHTITLTATDSDGASGSDAITISVDPNDAPTVAITAPADGTTFESGVTIAFSGTGTDPEDGTLTGGSLVWTSSIDGGIGTGTTFSTFSLSTGTHTITLTATDSDGASGSDAITVNVCSYFVVIGDNDGYGHIPVVVDGGDLPTNTGTIEPWIFDNREPEESSASDGSQHTDYEPFAPRFFSFTINFCPASPQAFATFTLDVSGIQGSSFGDSALFLDGVDYSIDLNQDQGTYGSDVISIDVDALLLTDGELTVEFQGGEGTTPGVFDPDAIAFDYFSLSIEN